MSKFESLQTNCGKCYTFTSVSLQIYEAIQNKQITVKQFEQLVEIFEYKAVDDNNRNNSFHGL